MKYLIQKTKANSINAQIKQNNTSMNKIYEKYLHFIWKYKYYIDKNLLLTNGKQITIINHGTYNCNEGPDFLNAHIKIDNIDFYGHVEIHINASDWIKHNHDNNEKYNNVILHVIFNDDIDIHKDIPTLVIKTYIHQSVLSFINFLIQREKNKILLTDDINYPYLVYHRYEYKREKIINLLSNNNNDWLSTTYHLIFFYFGFNVNNENMMILAQSFNYKIILKYDYQHILALLFGQSNLLDYYKSDDILFNDLASKYNFLKTKYDLINPNISWKRSRIHNPKSIEQRIEILAKMLYDHKDLIDWVFKSGIKQIRQDLNVYKLTSSTIDNILINIILPIRYSYNYYYNNDTYNETILNLKSIKPENNKYTRKMLIKNESAFDSQAIIEYFRIFHLLNFNI